MSAERVEAIRAEHVRHSGTWSGANDTGGLYCTCGDWEAGPDERGIRPWNEWHKHVAAALVAAETDGLAERDLRMDNADLARQLSDACARRADAYDEGYDTAMQHAHHVLNKRGYLERLGEDNGNPYRALLAQPAPSEGSERPCTCDYSTVPITVNPNCPLDGGASDE